MCERIIVCLDRADSELLKKINFLMSHHRVPFGTQVYEKSNNSSCVVAISKYKLSYDTSKVKNPLIGPF